MRIYDQEALSLLEEGDILDLGQRAAADARSRFGDTVTFIIDRNINYTNICQNECRFCAFFRRAGSPEGYVLSIEEILAKVADTVAAGGTQVMIQGGLNPSLPFSYYENMLRSIKENFPAITIHSFTATEIQHFAKKSGMSVADTLKRLQEAGLFSLPGGGAEILVDNIRSAISPKKISAADWLQVMGTAHRLGMKSTATMVIGFGETSADRIAHLRAIRRLQDETGGFRAFILWTFQPNNTALQREKVSSIEYLRFLALSRLYLDNIPHVQGSWVTQGEDIGQLTLAFGADDLGSVMLEENVVRAAGTSFQMSKSKMIRLIEATGKQAAQRDTAYRIIERF